MDEFMGVIKIFAGNFAPKGWAFCNGQLLSISQNSALFSLLGTTYGGDGQTSFALPDLRGRAPIHFGQGPGLSNYIQGQVSGTETNSLTIANMPTHNHPVVASMSVSSQNADQAVAVSGASIASPGQQVSRNFEPTLGFNSAAPNVNVSGLSVQEGYAGGNTPVNNIQPILAVNYIICLYGIYPSRG